MKKIAIVFDDPGIVGQTFVQYHISNLFGGETAVITRKKNDTNIIEKPHLVYSKVARGFPRGLAYGLSKLRRSRQFRDFVEKNNVGYVLAEFGYSGLLIYEDAARLDLPTYVYFRGADASSWLNSPKYARRLAAMMGSIDGVFAVSRSLIDKLHAYGIAHANEHVLPSGVDTAAFAPGKKDPNLIASVGRFISKKGHKISIGTFSRVCEAYPDLRLEIVGDGELLE